MEKKGAGMVMRKRGVAGKKIYFREKRDNRRNEFKEI